jgi:hypothetical protein
MRKALFSLLFALVVFAAPAFGQGHGSHSGGHSAPHHDEQGRSVQHTDKSTEKSFHSTNTRVGYHTTVESRTVYAQHWNGHAFDHAFFEGHWGYAHPFFWGHCGWYGPRWGIGSYFWYNGLYFTIIDTIPSDWYDANVVIIYDESCDCYYAVNPVYPGIRIHVGIRF